MNDASLDALVCFARVPDSVVEDLLGVEGIKIIIEGSALESADDSFVGSFEELFSCLELHLGVVDTLLLVITHFLGMLFPIGVNVSWVVIVV